MRRPSKFRVHEAFRRHPVFDYRPPAYLTAAKWGVVAFAIVTLLTALYVGLWYYAAGQLRDSTLAWIEARRHQGVTVGFARLDIGGFPFRLRLAVSKPAIAFPGAAVPWGWRGDEVTATLRPWNFERLTMDAAGNQTFTWTTGGKPHAVHGHVKSLIATLHLNGGRPAAVQAKLAGAAFSGDAPFSRFAVGDGTLRADFRPDPAATDRTPTADLKLTLKGLGTPPEWKLPLGADITAADLDASLMGRLAPGPLATTLAHWRDAGGTVEIHRFELTYGPLDVSADGTLALDAAMQPIGAFTARASGFFETVDALHAHGIIRSRDALTAKLVLGVLAKRDASGRAILTVPLTIQNRRLFAGPVPLLAIPPVSWKAIP